MKPVLGLYVFIFLAAVPDLLSGFALRLFNSEVYNQLKNDAAKDLLVKSYMNVTGPATLLAGKNSKLSMLNLSYFDLY